MSNTSQSIERILATVTPEQWEAIAEYASEMTNAKPYNSMPNEEVTPKYENMTEEELFLKVTDIMKAINMPAHLKGYQYFRAAVILAYGDWDYINKVTKRLYPKLAEDFNTTPSRVERAIRHAIEYALDSGDLEKLHKYFTYTVSKGKPTNSEAVASVVDYLKFGK